MQLALTSPVIVICILLVSASLNLAEPSGSPRGALRKVSVQEVKSSIETQLAELLGSDQDVHAPLSAARNRLAAIEAATWQTFQALPKNNLGRLNPRAVRYIVHNYFAKEHGWLISGLEPHGQRPNTTEMHDVSVLQDKAPALVEAFLEDRRADRGLVLGDIVAMIAVLERFIFNESLTLLETAYALNGKSVDAELDEDALHEVLQSYLLLFAQGRRADPSNVTRHQAYKAAQQRNRPEIAEYEHNAVLNFAYANRHTTSPFLPRQYTFKAATEIVGDLAQRYGKWQDAECRLMKEHLMELDPTGFGRVPLGAFYADDPASVYHFSESVDYLRKTGALDESGLGGPKVLVANYLVGPSNCIATSDYYSVCCLNECDSLMNELERHVQAPAVAPDRLLLLASHLSSASVDAPRQLPNLLVEKLHAIAALHGGEVPLHGRLFAQWLHYAFPFECPYPSLMQSAAALTPSEWLEGQATANLEERTQHIATIGGIGPSDADMMAQWTDDELLPLHASRRTVMDAARAMVLIAAVFVAIRTALPLAQNALHSMGVAVKKDDDLVLPMRM